MWFKKKWQLTAHQFWGCWLRVTQLLNCRTPQSLRWATLDWEPHEWAWKHWSPQFFKHRTPVLPELFFATLSGDFLKTRYARICWNHPSGPRWTDSSRLKSRVMMEKLRLALEATFTHMWSHLLAGHSRGWCRDQKAGFPDSGHHLPWSQKWQAVSCPLRFPPNCYSSQKK